MIPLRRVGPEALDELAALEARASLRPWTRAVIAEELSRDFAHVVVARGEPIAAAPGPLLGFIVYWLVRDELHVLNVATDPSIRRAGVGSRLLEHAIWVARRAGCTVVLLEVRRSNAPARRLYRKYGFRPIGVRANYYAEEHEDALVMRLDLSSLEP